MTGPKLSPGRRTGLLGLAAAPGGELRVSNATDLGLGLIYWQTGRWLVAQGYAVNVGHVVDERIRITEEGRELAASLAEGTASQ